MANNGIPASIARLRNLTGRIRDGERLSESEAHEILYFTPEENIQNDNPPEIIRVLEIIQRMQNGPPLNEVEIGDVLRLRKYRFADQVAKRVVNAARELGGVARSNRRWISNTARRIVIQASDNEDPALVEGRAIEAGIAFMRMTPEERETIIARNVLQVEQTPGVNCMQVHRVAATFRDKLPLIAVLIRNDLGEVPQHPSLIAHLDATVGKCIRESAMFESRRKPNSREILSRELWINDYERVKGKLTRAISSITDDVVKILEDILDFVFKYKLEECFVSNFIYDTAHAYEGNGRENESSCPAGAAERVYTTFFDCIKGMNEGVFQDLNKILKGAATSWKELDKAAQVGYQREFDNFVLRWATENLNNDTVKSMNSETRNKAVLAAFKARPGEPELPPFVEEFIRNEMFRGLTLLWEDYGFNSKKAGSAQGGRRTRYKKKFNRKITRKNKNKKKSLKAR